MLLPMVMLYHGTAILHGVAILEDERLLSPFDQRMKIVSSLSCSARERLDLTNYLFDELRNLPSCPGQNIALARETTVSLTKNPDVAHDHAWPYEMRSSGGVVFAFERRDDPGCDTFWAPSPFGLRPLKALYLTPKAIGEIGSSLPEIVARYSCELFEVDQNCQLRPL